jgi:hypothetical protein
MFYYVPAYQLKCGYRAVAGELLRGTDFINVPGRHHRKLRFGREIFASIHEALVIAREQRDDRIASLRGTLAKLEKLAY